MDLSYDGFGPSGPLFTRYYRAAWEAAGNIWTATRTADVLADIGCQDLESALACHMTFTDYLFNRCCLIPSYHPQPVRVAPLLLPLWTLLRSAVRSLPDWTSVREDERRWSTATRIYKCFAAAHEQPEVALARREIIPISYCAFTEKEMDWLLRRHRHIVEVGCGRGYFLNHYRERGGEGIGLENDLYALLRDHDGPTRTMSEQLIRDGHLVQMNNPLAAVAHFADRTLGIFWPQPRSAFPTVAIQRYREAGGQSLAIKLGHFVGSVRIDSGEEHFEPNGAFNVGSFFEELGRYWTLDHSAPSWVPHALGNNLLIFHRR